MTIGERIIVAIKAGAVTSAQISEVLRAKQSTVAVHLCNLANNGKVVRLGGTSRDAAGRSFVLWGLPGGISEGEPPHSSKFLAVMLIEEEELAAKLAAVRSVIAAYSPPAVAEIDTPAPIEARASAVRSEAADAISPVAGSGSEIEPATDARAKATKGKTCVDPRASTQAELRVGEAGVAHPRPGAGGGDVSRADAPSSDGPDVMARVERRNAWLRGEPLDVPEVETPPVVESADPVVTEPVSVDKAAEFSCPVAGGIDASPLSPVIAPKPMTTSAAASALAGAAKALQAAKEARGLAPTPPAAQSRPASPSLVGTAQHRMLTSKTAPAAIRGKSKADAPENVVADVRQPQTDLRTFRAAELGRGVVSYRKADAPAEQRGMVLVTAEFAGDPPPGRSALAQRQMGSSN